MLRALVYVHFSEQAEHTAEIIFLTISTCLVWLTWKSDTGEQIGFLFNDTMTEDVRLACVWYNPTTNNHSGLRSGLGLAWINSPLNVYYVAVVSHLLIVFLGSTGLQIQSYQAMLATSASTSKEWLWNITQGKGKPSINNVGIGEGSAWTLHAFMFSSLQYPKYFNFILNKIVNPF